MKKLALSLAFLFLSVNFAAADIRLPDKLTPTPTAQPTPATKDVRVPFNIRVQYNYNEPVLQIPRGSIKNLRAQLDALDNGGDANGATIGGTSGLSSQQTLISGLFLSLAMIFGGVWFARGKSSGKSQKITAASLVFLAFGASAFVVFANVAPPPLKNLDGSLFSDKMRSSFRGAEGTVKLEITDKNSDGRITLILPPAPDEKNNE